MGGGSSKKSLPVAWYPPGVYAEPADVEKNKDIPCICLSGGGARANGAACGTVKAYYHAGMLSRDKISYVSANSGGTWLFTPAYFRSSLNEPVPESKIYGSAKTDFSTITVGDLKQPIVAPSLLYASVNADLVSNVGREMFRSPLSKSWQRGIGRGILEPFGLYDSSRPGVICSSMKQAESLGLQSKYTIYYPRRENLPVFVQMMTLLYPPSFTFDVYPADTSVFTTGAWSHNYETLKSWFIFDSNLVIGGRCSTYSFNSADVDYDTRTTDLQARPWEPADATGISSNAIGGILQYTIPTRIFVPKVNNTNNADNDVSEATDGGYLDNLAVMSMLARGRKRIIVFDNSAKSLGGEMDSDLTTLFSGRKQVFKTELLDVVVNGMRDAQIKGDDPQYHGAVFTIDMEVLKNDTFGIPGNYTAKITWVYLAPCTTFYESLPVETSRYIKNNLLSNGWPNVPTVISVKGTSILIGQCFTDEAHALSLLQEFVTEKYVIPIM